MAQSAPAELARYSLRHYLEFGKYLPVPPNLTPELTGQAGVFVSSERVDSLAELDPKQFGVIVKRGERRGLLLPDLEGVDTVEEQVAIAMSKAGIAANETVELYRFSVTRYT